MEKKSIADLLAAKKKPSAAQIETITEVVHKPVMTSPPLPANSKEIMRISVNAPVELYLKSKTKATRQGMTLMAYIMKLMEEDANN
jgi:hypothetical protein